MSQKINPFKYYETNA